MSITKKSAEYKIYVYHKESQTKRQCKWEMVDKKIDRNFALKKAEKIFKTNNFSKVEIKKREFSWWENSEIDKTVKIFQEKNASFRKFWSHFATATATSLFFYAVSLTISAI